MLQQNNPAGIMQLYVGKFGKKGDKISQRNAASVSLLVLYSSN
jgi:hypothetical protein